MSKVNSNDTLTMSLTSFWFSLLLNLNTFLHLFLVFLFLTLNKYMLAVFIATSYLPTGKNCIILDKKRQVNVSCLYCYILIAHREKLHHTLLDKQRLKRNKKYMQSLFYNDWKWNLFVLSSSLFVFVLSLNFTYDLSDS